SPQLRQPIVIENRPGAGGTIGAALVAKSGPDGYTLFVHSSSYTVTPSTYKDLPYDTLRDLTGVIPLALLPNALVMAPPTGTRSGEHEALARAPRASHDARGRRSRLRLQLLGRHVCAGQDAARGRRPSLRGNDQGAARGRRAREDGAPRRRADGLQPRAVQRLSPRGDRRQCRAGEGGGHQVGIATSERSHANAIAPPTSAAASAAINNRRGP